jgi:uncharacterized protein YoxC
MSDTDALDERLCAVERALTDDDSGLTDLRDAAELTREIEALAGRIDDVEDRLDELDAATQALRGYVGNVRSVNESVERRADAALAKAESVEAESGQPKSASAPDARPTRVCDCEHAHERDSGRGVESEHNVRGTGRKHPRDSESEREDLGLLARIVEAL